MPLGFGGNRAQHQRVELRPVAVAQDPACVELVVGEEAGPDLAVGGEPQPVAVTAELIRQRRDEADGRLRPGEAVIPRRPPAARCPVADDPQQPSEPRGSPRRRQLIHGFVARDMLGFGPEAGIRGAVTGARTLVAPAHRHVLDEPDVHRPLHGELRESAEFLVERPHRHDIHFDGAHPCGQGRVDAGERVLEPCAPRREAVDLRIERIDGDVHSIDPCGRQVAGHSGEKRSVGRQGDGLDPGYRFETADQVHQTAPHERFAAGQAEFRDTLGGRNGGEALDLVEGEDVSAILQLDRPVGHAVDTAHVAAVRDRDPEVVDAAPECVDGHI